MLKLGSYVKILKPKNCYNEYTEYAKRYHLKYDIAYHNLPPMEDEYRVVFIGEHTKVKRQLCVVRSLATELHYIMDYNPSTLEVVIPKNSYYLTCPKCDSNLLSEIGDSMFRCSHCNYIFGLYSANYEEA